MVTRNAILIVMGWLFLIFGIFFFQKLKTFRLSYVLDNAGVGNDPRDRKFNINGQVDRYDPQGKYRKLWLQETLF